ncbi:CGNR zinc finger domain-containing protein [Saccharothrix sp. NPDC042600]|uniref:CGNR zinc finger domain-containing protein n=1 Tax=Saccharothrix TaxID=2071 RepID=UPI0033DF4C4B|nr:CGNR zinc finger domain-containing protein [Saccharothrix mutabilis subsp. capreolus]
MSVSQRIPHDQRRRFRTGRPCLDFTHTGGDGPYAVWELLHTPDDVALYVGGLLDVELTVADADVAALKPLRTALTNAARGAARGIPPADADVDVINAVAADPPLVPRLADGRVVLTPGTLPQALSTLARDAIDLFSSPLRDRVRVCAAEDCGLLFVDASRPGLRRWCSMERCGDRAKKRKARAGG